MSRHTFTTRHADGTRSTYALQPGSTVPAQLAALKPLKPSRIKADPRRYPKYKPGMSTAEYVALYEATNNSGMHCGNFWQTLNTSPAAGYLGLDSVEHGDWDQLPDDAAELAPAALVADAPAAPVATVDPTPAAPAPAEPATLQAWRRATAGAGLQLVDSLADAEALAAACIARYGSGDPAACAHLASWPVWLADQVAQLRPAPAERTPAPIPADHGDRAPPQAAPALTDDPCEAHPAVIKARARLAAAQSAIGDTSGAGRRWYGRTVAARLDRLDKARAALGRAIDNASRLAGKPAAAARTITPTQSAPTPAPIAADQRQPAPAADPAAAAPSTRHPRMADAVAILAAAVAPATAPVQPLPDPPPTRRPGLDADHARAARLAAELVAILGTDPARLAEALRRQSARVAAAADTVPATIAHSYRATAAHLATMADDEAQRAAAAPPAMATAAPTPAPARAPSPQVAPQARPRAPAAAAGPRAVPLRPMARQALHQATRGARRAHPAGLAWPAIGRLAPAAGRRVPAGARAGCRAPPPPVAASTLTPPPPVAASARLRALP